MSEFREKWPEMRMKHLELVQNVITRMGANSSSLKGYCMGITAAMIALAGVVGTPSVLLFALPIVLIFSVLDAHYLMLERGFKNHYNDLRTRKIDIEPDFLIETSGNEAIFDSFLSWSVLGFYGSAAIIIIVISWLL